MQGGERRSRERCPVCQGPMHAGGMRCRNSLCTYNHKDVPCPRCGEKGPEATQYDGTSVSYFCRECHNKWQAQAS